MLQKAIVGLVILSLLFFNGKEEFDCQDFENSFFYSEFEDLILVNTESMSDSMITQLVKSIDQKNNSVYVITNGEVGNFDANVLTINHTFVKDSVFIYCEEFAYGYDVNKLTRKNPFPFSKKLKIRVDSVSLYKILVLRDSTMIFDFVNKTIVFGDLGDSNVILTRSIAGKEAITYRDIEGAIHQTYLTALVAGIVYDSQTNGYKRLDYSVEKIISVLLCILFFYCLVIIQNYGFNNVKTYLLFKAIQILSIAILVLATILLSYSYNILFSDDMSIMFIILVGDVLFWSNLILRASSNERT